MARGFRRVRQSTANRGPDLTSGSRSSERAADSHERRSATVMQGGRAKAYRPLPPELRRKALDDGLAAYAHGNFFEAHDLLEPAWMGTDDLAERALYQGLIKLAAGYVHAVRGNPIGVERNLRGARAHLETSLSLDEEVARRQGIDARRLLDDIDNRLAAVAQAATALSAGSGRLIDLLPAAPSIPPPPLIRG